LIDWTFIWSTKRPPIWEAVATNMNNIFWDSDRIPERYKQYVLPVNNSDVPAEHHALLAGLSAPVLNQFENESFKFVVQPNSGMSQYNRQDQLVLKEHMFPDMMLSDDNCKTLNLDRIYELINQYEWIALGLMFSNSSEDIRLSKRNTVASSVLYTRDKDTLDIVYLDTDNQPDNTLSVLAGVTYIVFQKLTDPEIVLGVLNPHLVSLAPFDASIMQEKHRISIIDGYELTIKQYLLEPKISQGKLIAGDTIFAKDGKVVIDLFLNSTFCNKYNCTPDIPFAVESNLPFEISNNRIIIESNKTIGYVSIEFNVGDMTDTYRAIKKLFGKTNIDFKIIGK